MSQKYNPPAWAADPICGAYITSSKEGDSSQKIPLDTRRCTVFGRLPDLVDVAFPDATLSRMHGAIFFGKEGVFIIDLGSGLFAEH